MATVKEVVENSQGVWKTEAAFWSWVKGGIRKSLWNRNPIKLLYIKDHRVKIPNPNPKGKVKEVWGAKCEICQQYHVLRDMQCDHKDEETAHLTKLSDIQGCFEKLILVTPKDLRLICKQCHAVHSLRQRNGMTFEDAKIEKQVIAFAATPAKDQIKTLTELVKDETILNNAKNAAERKNLYREYLKGNV